MKKMIPWVLLSFISPLGAMTSVTCPAPMGVMSNVVENAQDFPFDWGGHSAHYDGEGYSAYKQAASFQGVIVAPSQTDAKQVDVLCSYAGIGQVHALSEPVTHRGYTINSLHHVDCHFSGEAPVQTISEIAWQPTTSGDDEVIYSGELLACQSAQPSLCQLQCAA